VPDHLRIKLNQIVVWSANPPASISLIPYVADFNLWCVA
jgi:hypothetical protein